MRTGELECFHGQGHSAGVHGCDGCCIPLVRKAKAEAWEEGLEAKFKLLEGQESVSLTNPYRQENHATDSD